MGGRGYGGGGRGRVYTNRYTVTTRMTPALWWAAMRANFNVSTNHNFRRERRAEAVWNRGPSAYQPTALPLGQTGSLYVESVEVGVEGDYIPIATRMTSALRWAAMRAILMFHNCDWHKVTRQCPEITTFEEKRERKRIRTEVPLFTSLTP